MNIGATIFDGRNVRSARFGAHVKREISLPPAPFVGMLIVTENDFWRVKEVRWVVPNHQLFLVLDEKFKESDIEGIGFPSFEAWLEMLTRHGWNCSRPFGAR